MAQAKKKSSKKISGYIKLQIPAGAANPAPPVGPALGQKGVNIKQFCDAFNDATKNQRGDTLPVVITVFADKSFEFQVKTPPASHLIKKAIKLSKGSSQTGKEVVGKVTVQQLREIAERKIVDMNAYSMDAAVEMLRGTAVSMGLDVVDS